MDPKNPHGPRYTTQINIEKSPIILVRPYALTDCLCAMIVGLVGASGMSFLSQSAKQKLLDEAQHHVQRHLTKDARAVYPSKGGCIHALQKRGNPIGVNFVYVFC